MRILLADQLPEHALQDLRDDGHEVVSEPGLTTEDLADRLDHDVLVVRSTRVTAAAIGTCPRLALIVRAGSGTNTIDTETASSRGVFVCNVPGQNAVAVAELAIGLLCAIDRRIPDNVADLREGRWNKRTYQHGRGLLGRDVGVVGLGEIGLAFAQRAAALGMRVHGIAKPGRSPDTQERIERHGLRLLEDLPTLARTCDVLSFHVPATPQTRGLVGRELLSHVRDGSIIINTSRGEVVDEEALLDALDAKGLWAGLDVYRDEPSSGEASFTSDLAAHPRVYGTHHIGASTQQAQTAVAGEVVDIVRAFVRGQIRNCVNLETGLGTCTLLVRHHDRVGALASVFEVLKRAGINVEQMDNEVFEGARAACASMRVAGEITDEVRAAIAALPDVIHLSVAGSDSDVTQV